MKDLIIILNDDYITPMWVANAPLRNSRSDDFLSMLEINEYKVSDFVTVLSDMPDHIYNWIRGKSDEWHQQLYAMLADYINNAPDNMLQSRIGALLKLKIVRLTDNTYEQGKNCFFPDESDAQDKQMPRVNREVYSTGANKAQQDKAKFFLDKIGVRVVGEVEQIETLLKINYSQDAVNNKMFNPKIKDIKRFIKFIDNEPSQFRMFENAYIFKCNTGKWGLPKQIYLDGPFLETGLSTFYDAISEKAVCWQLSDEYKDLKISHQRIGEFAKKVGAISCLKIVKKQGYKWIDYGIEQLACHLQQTSLPISRLIWNVLVNCELSHDYSYFCRSEQSRVYYYDVGKSEIINMLSDQSWVPQKSSTDSIVFVAPKNADSMLLPDGFAFDNGWTWLKKVSFGSLIKLRDELKRQEELKNNTEVQQNELAAKRIGFSSLSEAQELAEAKKRDPQGFARWLAGTIKPIFPKKKSPDPVRRSDKMEEAMADAPQKKYEERPRSVRTTSNTLDTEKYLRLSYENEDGQLICQICKDVMPFKKRNNEFYLEKVEIFTKEYLKREHQSHYLALCPLCSAKYKEYVKSDPSQMNEIRDSLLRGELHEIPINLDEDTTIQFVDTHFDDLKDSIICDNNADS